MSDSKDNSTPATAAATPSSVAPPATGDADLDARLAAIRIETKQPDAPMVDIMGGDGRREVNVHDHGLVALVDVMPRMVPEGQTADFAIVQAARVSYGVGTKHVSHDRGLIRYLARHRHSTPFEMVEFKFHCVMPIFIARQWIRHRTANVNEYSARYSIVPDRFYRPEMENVRRQSTANRQGGEETLDAATAAEFMAYLDAVESQYGKYTELLERGLTREQARMGLPVSVYTEWYWKCDLHNIMHFLSLRMDPHAQAEIRDYAMAMFALIQPIVPIASEAFLDYRYGGMLLTRLEIEALRSGDAIAIGNSRERAEWDDKRERLGLAEIEVEAAIDAEVEAETEVNFEVEAQGDVPD